MCIRDRSDPARMSAYQGEFSVDQYGRKIPKHAHGTINLHEYTSSTSVIVKDVLDLFERIINKNLLVRRLNMSANHVINKDSVMKNTYEQLNFFDLMNKQECKEEKEFQEKEENIQKAVLDIKNKFGRNAILKGMSLQAVSYTHLDVYKRQILCSVRYFLGIPLLHAM